MFVSANYVEDFKLVYIQNKTIMEWRTINGYGGVYQVSNTGVVKRLHHVTINKKGVAMTFKEKRIKPFKDKSDCKVFEYIVLNWHGHLFENWIFLQGQI